MGTLRQEIEFFSNVNSAMVSNVRKTVDLETRALRDKIASGSPVSSGRYKQAWRVNKTRTGSSSSLPLIASSSIHNPLEYASALEFGISKGDSPNHSWVRSVNKGTSKGLATAGSRIWSAKAVGGTMMKEFSPSYKQRLTRTVADSVIEVFK